MAAGKRTSAYKTMRQGIVRERLPRRMFSELFFHLSLFLGFPAMIESLEELYRIHPKQKQPTGKQLRQNIHSDGRRLFERIYGDQTRRVLEHLNKLHPDLSERIVHDAYGRVLSRKGLTLRERELVNVAVLCIQGFRPQLYSHIRGAFRVGISADALKSLFRGIEKLVNIRSVEGLKMLSDLEKSLP